MSKKSGQAAGGLVPTVGVKVVLVHGQVVHLDGREHHGDQGLVLCHFLGHPTAIHQALHHFIVVLTVIVHGPAPTLYLV